MESFIRQLKHNRPAFELFTAILVGFLAGRIAIKNQLAAIIALPLLLLGISVFVYRESAVNSLARAASIGLFSSLVLLYITGIPKIAPLPFSPIFLVIGFYLLHGIFNPTDTINSLRNETGKIFLLMALCWLLRYAVAFISTGSLRIDMQIIELAGIAIAIKSFVKNDPERAKTATRIAALVLILSIAWFLMEQFLGALPVARYLIYKPMYATADERTMSLTFKLANGLSPYIFLFGYQMAAAVPLTVILFLSERNKYLKALWAVGSVMSVSAMALLAERSVALAGFAAILFYLYRRKRFAACFALMSIIAASIVLMQALGSENIFTRLKSTESMAEGFDRLWLQLTGISVAFKNPLGLMVTGGSWAEEVYSSGADFSTWGGIEIGIHNSYIGRVIAYGWVFGALMIVVILRLLKGIGKALQNSTPRPKDSFGYADATAASLLSILIQALFHNSSIFTFNGVSIMALFLFLMWHDIMFNSNNMAFNAGGPS